MTRLLLSWLSWAATPKSASLTSPACESKMFAANQAKTRKIKRGEGRREGGKEGRREGGKREQKREGVRGFWLAPALVFAAFTFAETHL